MIDYKGENPRYFDKNGVEITDGCMVKDPSGRVQKIYLTENGYLGTDATNPLWIIAGRAVPCQFGIYPLTEEETEELEVVSNG